MLQYTGPEADAVSEQGYGWQTAEQWQAMADMLTEFDVMEETDVSQVFTNEILQVAQERIGE